MHSLPREGERAWISGFREFSLSFPFMGFAIFSSSFFTALSDDLISAAISFLRTMVFWIAALLFAAFLIAKRRRYRH